MNSLTIFYLATNVFDKGGIQRYSRMQIQTLREIIGQDNITCYSLRPASENKFEEPFVVHYIGRGDPKINRIRYSIKVFFDNLSSKPNIIWTNHIKLLPLATIMNSFIAGSLAVSNVYGLEMWSGLRIFEKFAIKSATKIVSDCYSTANYINKYLGVQSKRIEVIWDPVDTGRFFPNNRQKEMLKKYGIPYYPNTCYIMTLGRITRNSLHKGYDRIIDVVGSISKRKVVYLVVGDGDERPRLQNRVIQEGLTDRVFFLGSIPEYELVDVYNAADIFVLVSDRGPGRGEGVPLTPLEAAACGKPIIVGNEDGSKEAVIDGENGFIVSPRDLDAIRRAILNLADNEELRRRMGLSARIRIEKEFSKEAFKIRTEKLLESLIINNAIST